MELNVKPKFVDYFNTNCNITKFEPANFGFDENTQQLYIREDFISGSTEETDAIIDINKISDIPFNITNLSNIEINKNFITNDIYTKQLIINSNIFFSP